MPPIARPLKPLAVPVLLVSALLFCGLLFVRTRPRAVARWALPPADGEKLERLLAPSAPAFTDGYVFEGARIDRTVIIAQYASRSGDASFTVELSRPEAARDAWAVTERFAVHLRARDDAGLETAMEHLVEQVRKNEHEWRWLRTAPATAGLDWGAWDPWVTGYLLLLFILVLGANMLPEFRRAPRAPPRNWDRRDIGAAALVAAALAIRLWRIDARPITGDEFYNLQPEFWSTWFSNVESCHHPPLFRALVHLSASVPESLWAMRAPAAVFGALSVGVLYAAIRRWNTGPAALLLSAPLLLQPLHLDYSRLQKPYTLWLVLLLLGQLAFSGALRGERRQWPRYSLWMLLAAMTHYLSVLYFAGQLAFTALRRRKELRSCALALAPPALALIPLAIRMSIEPSDRGGGFFELGFSYLSTLDPQFSFLFGRNIPHLALAPAAWCLLPLLAPRRERPPGDASLPWVIGCGGLGLLLLGFHGALAGKYFFPLIPLGLLYAGSRLAPSWKRWPKRQLAALLLAAYWTAAGGIAYLNGPHASGSLSWPDMSALLAARAELGAARGPALGVHPPWMIGPAYFEMTRRRDPWAAACPGMPPASARVLRVRDDTLFSLPAGAAAGILDGLLPALGRFDFLLIGKNEEEREYQLVRSWLERRCRRRTALTGSGTLFQCLRGTPDPAADSCAIFRRTTIMDGPHHEVLSLE